MTRSAANADRETVEGFGDEWSRFDYANHSERELREIFDGYFAVFPWEALPADAQGFDLGCGSGRWARLVAPRVGHLHCIDASRRAVDVATRTLAKTGNVTVHHASVEAMPVPDGSMDFGYSLGVLHHVPDTAEGVRACVRKLRPGAPFLLYLYYALDNRPWFFRGMWRASDLARRGVSRLPHSVRYAVSQVVAGGVYWPLSRGALLAERAGLNVDDFPLAAYRKRSFYVMRTDALDRFGTRLERRFTRREMYGLMVNAGLTDIKFSDRVPYWTAVGYRAA